MSDDKLREKILVLRNYHKSALEVADSILKDMELSPSKPRKRANKKADRKLKYENILASGRWNKQAPITDKTLNK